MTITLYKTNSDPKRINKTLYDAKVLTGTLRAEASLMSPEILIESEQPLPSYNYAWIEEFGRYYYISNIEFVRQSLFRVSLVIDVLMSWRSEILNATAIVDKQERLNPGTDYIDDGDRVLDSRKQSQIISFPGGFPDDPVYILVTAGAIT